MRNTDNSAFDLIIEDLKEKKNDVRKHFNDFTGICRLFSIGQTTP